MSLLMSSLATNRKNTKTLVKNIEEDLERYGRTTVIFPSSSSEQKFIVPYGKAGWYKIELWQKNYPSGQNHYVSAAVKLIENQHLSFDVNNGHQVSVKATSRNTEQLLLSTGDFSENTLNGNGIIEDADGNPGLIKRKFGFTVSASGYTASSKAKIQMLPPETESLSDNKFSSGSSFNYYIKFRDNNEFVGINGALITTTLYDETKSLEWLIEKISNENPNYKIINISANKALAVGNSGELTLVDDFDSGNTKHHWNIISVGTNHYIQNVWMGKYLNSTTISEYPAEVELIKSDY